MGIDIDWKKVVDYELGWPEMSHEKAGEITVVMDDMSLNVRRLLYGVDSWEALGALCRARVEFLASKGKLKEYWVFWDEPKWVPPNKRVTQRKRDSRGSAPFTDAEQLEITVGVGPIPSPSGEWFERLMATRSMHESLHTFIATELALTKLPEDMRLVLDGARAKGIMHRQMKGAPLKIMNMRVPESEYQVMSDIEQARIDHPGRIIVMRSTNNPDENSVLIYESHRIGESDLKIPAAIAEQDSGAQIFLRTCDTDMFPIVLMHMKNYLEDRKIKYGIFTDTEGPGRKVGSAPVIPIDMVELWRVTLKHFRGLWPTVPPVFAIETLATLMLLSGSDYADRLPQIGARTVWDAFVDPVGRGSLFPLNRPNEPGVIADDVRGQPKVRVNIQLHEARVRRFIAYMYHKKTHRNVPFPTTAAYTLDASRAVRVAAREKVIEAGKAVTVRNAWQVPSDDAIAAAVRRLHWNLDYFVNGSKIEGSPFLNPVLEHDRTQESIHGWVVNADNNNLIECANCVYTES